MSLIQVRDGHDYNTDQLTLAYDRWCAVTGSKDYGKFWKWLGAGAMATYRPEVSQWGLWIRNEYTIKQMTLLAHPNYYALVKVWLVQNPDWDCDV